MTTTRLPRRVMASGLAGAAILAGAGVAALVNHGGSNLPVVEIRNAAASGSTSTTTPAGTSGTANEAKPARGPKGEPIDDATLAKVKAAALAAVDGATFEHAHKLPNDGGYKALLTKADGTTKVLVTEDKDFKVTKVEDPAPARPAKGPGGPRHQQLDAATLAKVKAAAEAAVPGATFKDAFKLKDDEGYKAMLLKADGKTRVLVTEDANFNVTKVEDPAPVPPMGGPHGERAPLDDATAAKVKAAALEAVPGATVDKVGHDRDGGYVAMLTKADGTTRVLVHEDKDFKVTKVQDPAPARPEGGPGGKGGHRGPGGPGFGDGGDAPAATGTNA